VSFIAPFSTFKTTSEAASFQGTSLRKARFPKCKLIEVNFDNGLSKMSDLSEIDFSLTEINDYKFNEANLHKARIVG